VIDLHIEFLVEEFSAQEALNNILPKIFDETISFKIHAFRGKLDLLAKLPKRLNGYKDWMPSDYRIVVLIDEDRQDCRQLKQKLETIAMNVGLATKSSVPPNQSFQVLNRIVVEELEAWFFGDVPAIISAYPRISSNLSSQANYRDPDAISGGTWEALERVLQQKGFHSGGLEKARAAREISLHMNPSQNTSKSFQVFRDGLLEMLDT
jgi:Domain of unknown function (DUF4276)